MRGTPLGVFRHPNDWTSAQMEIKVYLDHTKSRFLYDYALKFDPFRRDE